MKKDKVIAIRVTQDQYDILEWARVNVYEGDKEPTMSAFVNHALSWVIGSYRNNKITLEKQAAATAKRKATREAKKAANDTK